MIDDIDDDWEDRWERDVEREPSHPRVTPRPLTYELRPVATQGPDGSAHETDNDDVGCFDSDDRNDKEKT